MLCSLLFAFLSLSVPLDNGTATMRAVIHDIPRNVFQEIYRVPEAEEIGNALYLRGNFLFCGSGTRVQLYDVSEPLSPRLRSQCTINGRVRQLVADDRAVYVTSRGNGLHIVDISNPDDIKYASHFDTIELATGVDVAGDVLFVTLRCYGVEFIDVRDIYNPQHIRLQKTIESQSCWYQDGYLYSGEWGKGMVTTISAWDMEKVDILTTTEIYGHGDGVCTLGNRLYAATGCNARNTKLSGEAAKGKGHGLDVLDISNPAHPRFIGRAQFDSLYVRGSGDWWTVRPSADGKTAFVADTFNGLYAVDLSDENHPRVTGRISIDKIDTPSTPGTFISSVAVGNGVVYATGQKYGLIAVKCAKAKPMKRDLGRLPQHPEYRYPYETPAGGRFEVWRPDVRAQVRALALTEDNLLLAACSYGGLYVLKKDRKGKLVQIGKGPMSFAGDVSVRNGRVYVAEGSEGLGVYTIDSAGHFTQITRMDSKEIHEGYRLVLWVDAVSDRYLVVNDRACGNVVLDMENFPKMIPVLTHHQGTTWWDKYIAEDVAPNGALGASVTGVCMSWIYLDGKPRNSARDRSVRPSGSAATFRDGTVLVNLGGNLAQLEPGVVPAKIIASKKGNFKGTPIWDGADALAIDSRHHKEIKRVYIPSVEEARIVWQEVIEGCPDRPIFWDGKILVPGGYQGVLIEK